MMGNGRPIGKRQAVRLLVALTILAWATQTLFHQWGYGATVVDADNPAETSARTEQFVPPDIAVQPATLLLQPEATIIGEEVRLKQVCRWPDSNRAVFDPMADLILLRLPMDHPNRSLSMEELQRTLGEAGVNLAMIRFGGSIHCMVSRSDTSAEAGEGLQQWLNTYRDKEASNAGATTRPVGAVAEGPAGMEEAQRVQVTTVRELLLADLAQRLSLSVDALQVRFNPQDRATLDLSTPQFQFNVQPVRVYNLGDVSWDVTIFMGGSSQKVRIRAQAFAWRQEVVAVRPLAYKQMIRPEDVVSRRTLVNRVVDEPLLTMDQVVGQQSARQLKPGALFTASMVESAPMVRPGQLVTVILSQGRIEVKTVGRAMESGAYGQTIKVRSERTRDIYEAVVSGPQTVRLGSAATVASATKG